MKLSKLFRKTPDVDIIVKRNPHNQVGERWEVRFSIGNQSFNLKGAENKEVAEWYKEMLTIALNKLK